ncbi:hypothetical protein BV20DRAFT_628014 [Pilatotrama ljubarskyi]|nr:hypothetical protein BV20DRAFT_628014 [Pilatotrama ljubarskyi]
MESSFYTTEIAPGMMASSSDSPSSAFALSLLPAHSSAAIRVSSHGSPDIYRIATPATPTPSASLSGIHSHRAGPSADGTLMATGRAGMTGAQPTYPKGDTTSELYESHTANLPSRIIPFQDMGDDYAVSGPHVLCVSRASEERLLSTGNVANTLAKDKIKVLTHELQSLRIEADVQRKLYEELISKQMYHGFSGNHIKGVLSHTKPEPSEPDHHLLGPRSTPGPSGESQKRARQGSLGASLSSNKPSKILRISPAPSPCDGPAASASQVASQFPSRASSSTGSASGHISGSITSTIGTSSTVPDDFASAATADIAPAHGIQGGADSTGKGPDVQTRMPGTAAPSSAEEANQAPSPTPAGDSLQSSHSTQQQSAVDIELSQHPEAVVTTVTIPVKKPFTASSGSRRRSSRFVQSAHDSEPDAQPDMSEAEGTGAAASSIGKSTTRWRS